MDEDLLGIIMVIIVVIGCCVVLPIMIVWLTNKRKSHEIDKQTEILIAMLEKHPDLDPAEVMKKLNVSSKQYKAEQTRRYRRMMVLVFVAGVLTGGILMLVTLLNPTWLIPQITAPAVFTTFSDIFPKVCLLLAICFISLGATGLVGSVVLNKKR